MALSSSLEDYLENILLLTEQEGTVHVKDIADKLGVKMPSVTQAMQNLRQRDLINYEPYSEITLTSSGRYIAQKIKRRHRVFASFFRDVLGLSPDEASSNACRMEHAVDDVLLERLAEYLEFTKDHSASCAKLRLWKSNVAS